MIRVRLFEDISLLGFSINNKGDEVAITQTIYPDGTKKHVLDLDSYKTNSYKAVIIYYYESPNDYLDIVSITTTLKNAPFIKEISLVITYMPNARMDRVKNICETFTLKAFTDLINLLPLDYIYVFDPHSSASELLLDKANISCKEIMDNFLVEKLNKHIKNNITGNFYIGFPDAGAQKRYTDIIDKCDFRDRVVGVFTGNKIRDWQTGEIKKVEVSYSGGALADYRDIVIIDDICSKGGTFKYFIKAIQDNKDWQIYLNYYLYVSHLEPAVLEGELLTNSSLGLVRILTTNSLQYLWANRGLDIKSNNKIKVIDMEGLL